MIQELQILGVELIYEKTLDSSSHGSPFFDGSKRGGPFRGVRVGFRGKGLGAAAVGLFWLREGPSWGLKEGLGPGFISRISGASNSSMLGGVLPAKKSG